MAPDEDDVWVSGIAVRSIKMKHFDYIFGLIVGIFAGALISWSATFTTLNDMWETEAVEVGAAHFDTKTREFAWNEQEDGL